MKRTVMWTERVDKWGIKRPVKWYVKRRKDGTIKEWQRYKRCHRQDIQRSSKAERAKKR